MKKLEKFMFITLTCIGLVSLQACNQEGPLEEAGEELDDAARDAGDAVEDACEEATDTNC